MIYRKSKVNPFRLNDLELIILNEHFKNNGYTDVRDYIQKQVVQQYYDVAICKIIEMKKSITN